MEYTRTQNFRAYLKALVYLSDGNILLTPFYIAYLTWIALIVPPMAPYTLAGAIILVVYIAILIANYLALIKGNDGSIQWRHHLQPDKITLSTANITIDLTKSKITTVRVYSRGVFFKQPGAAAYLALPDGQQKKAIKFLEDNGWLVKKRTPYTTAILMTVVLLVTIGCIVYAQIAPIS